MTVPIRVAILLTGSLLISGLRADVTHCACDVANPETMTRFECSLCKVAEKQPPDVPYFFLKDNNPIKPHRWLILPRKHYPAGHDLDNLTDAEWVTFWNAAIRKARELWNNDWGLAYNGEKNRRQCHGHVHIGKLLQGVELDNFIVVKDVAKIPRPHGAGLWIHPVGNKLHVHSGEGITETVLLR